MSFTQGLSGLSAASSDLDVIGNNVANVNTVGFKSSQAQFADVFAASLGGAGGGAQTQIGIGTKLATVAQQFTQGSVVSTSNPLDMAINGPGFFIMKGVNGVGYTRNGQFQVDKSGNIVSSTGENLQGWPATNGVVASSGPTANLTISTAQIPPVQTNSIAVGLNLDSRSPVATDVVSTGFNPTDASSYNFSTSSTVYDSKGIASINTMYFQLAAPAISSANVVPAFLGAAANGPIALNQTVITVTGGGLLPNVGQTIETAAQGGAGAGAFPQGTTVIAVNPNANPPTFTTSAGATATDPGGTGVTFSGFVNYVPTGVAGLYPGEDVGDVLGGGAPSGIVIQSVDSVNNTFTTAPAVANIPPGQIAGATGDITTLPGYVAPALPLAPGAPMPTSTFNFGPTSISNIVATSTTSATVTVGVGETVTGLSVGQTIAPGLPGNFPVGTTITSINASNNSFTTSAPAGVGFATTGNLAVNNVDGNTWNVYTTVADPNAAGGTYLYPNPSPLPGTWSALGTLTFNNVTGGLTSPPTMQLPANFLGTYPGVNTGTSALPGVGIQYNFAGATQYGASSAVTKMVVNGYTTGNLVGYSAAANGQITGNYSNGQTQLLGQVALATFADNQGLQQIGDNEWSATIASGSALTNVPGTGLNGVLQTSSVEESNTDLTAELVNMITAQRNYQANAQTIKTQETVMQTLINMR